MGTKKVQNRLYAIDRAKITQALLAMPPAIYIGPKGRKEFLDELNRRVPLAFPITYEHLRNTINDPMFSHLQIIKSTPPKKPNKHTELNALGFELSHLNQVLEDTKAELDALRSEFANWKQVQEGKDQVLLERIGLLTRRLHQLTGDELKPLTPSDDLTLSSK